jgi:hypothetical protein
MSGSATLRAQLRARKALQGDMWVFSVGISSKDPNPWSSTSLYRRQDDHTIPWQSRQPKHPTNQVQALHSS